MTMIEFLFRIIENLFWIFNTGNPADIITAIGNIAGLIADNFANLFG
jgi:hypothetical protein